MSAVDLQILVGADLHAAPQLTTSKAPGIWIESFPGEPFGIQITNISGEALRAVIFIDSKPMQRVRLNPDDSFCYKSVLSERKGDLETRLPLLFGTPMVQEHSSMAAASVASDASDAASLGVIRVDYCPAPPRSACLRCVTRKTVLKWNKEHKCIGRSGTT